MVGVIGESREKEKGWLLSGLAAILGDDVCTSLPSLEGFLGGGGAAGGAGLDV